MDETNKRRTRAVLWPALRARPRLLGAIAFGAVVGLAGWFAAPLQAATVVLGGWNAGALLYLALAWHLMRNVEPAVIQRRAPGQDEGSGTIIMLVVVAAAAVLLAVASQVAYAKDQHGAARAAHLGLAGLTIATSWTFTQVLFALHYAHDFYLARERHQAEPLQFPGTEHPRYSDFVYFACIIGTSAQTADVSFASTAIRRVGTVHCVLAFFFNAALLGLTINVLAGLL
jgi:uncharacterized membrane protein